ncbi:hypothetical protein, no similarity [Maudiozyma saulgeensis]|uniref:Uncharacterized protein n=1 Tax=Maudiozyma saulgeensis TaxID=1789683 RepID=A0A1X7R6U7_9SACH|nr:hypothetical protein, no similarity [Kazachstania saulgeensis]
MQSESEEEEQETSEESSEEETSSGEEEEERNDENIKGISDMSSYEGDDSFEGESDSGDESSYEEVQEGKMGFLSKNRSGGRKKSFSTTKPTTFKPTMGIFNKKDQNKKSKKPLATTTSSEKPKTMKGIFSKKPAKQQILHQKPVVGRRLSKAMQPGNQRNPFGVKKSPEGSKIDVKNKVKGKDKSVPKKQTKTKKSLKTSTEQSTIGKKNVGVEPITKRRVDETEEKIFNSSNVPDSKYSEESQANNGGTSINGNKQVEQTQSNSNDVSTKKTLNPSMMGNQTNIQLPPGRFITPSDFASSSSVDIPGGLPTSTQQQIIGYYLFSNSSTPVKESSPIEELQNSKESSASIDGDNLTVSTSDGKNYSFKAKPFYSNEGNGNASESPLGNAELEQVATSSGIESNNTTKNIVNDSSNTSSPLMTNSNEMKYTAQFQPTVAPGTDGQPLSIDTSSDINSEQKATTVVKPSLSARNTEPFNDEFTTPTTPTTSKQVEKPSSLSSPPTRISSRSKPIVSTTEAKIAAMKAKGVKRLPRESNGAIGRRSDKDSSVPRSSRVKMGGMFGGRSSKPAKDKKALKEKEEKRSRIRDSIITSFT